MRRRAMAQPTQTLRDPIPATQAIPATRAIQAVTPAATQATAATQAVMTATSHQVLIDKKQDPTTNRPLVSVNSLGGSVFLRLRQEGVKKTQAEDARFPQIHKASSTRCVPTAIAPLTSNQPTR